MFVGQLTRERWPTTGVDNIVSCLYLDLVRRDSNDSDGPPLMHPTLAADNCSRQNKNKTMIKFCAWLFEAKWAKTLVKKATHLFLVKGARKTTGVNVQPSKAMHE